MEILVGIVLLVIWAASEFDLLIGFFLLLMYGAWFPAEDSSETEKTELRKQMEQPVDPVLIQKEVLKAKEEMKSPEQKCLDKDGIWMYDECVK